MDSGRGIFRLFRFVLIGYWVVFIGYTIKNFMTGGQLAVETWYRHVSQRPFETQWGWGVFWAQQAALLLITILVCLFGKQPKIRAGTKKSDA